MSERHPSVTAILKHFQYEHLPDNLKGTSRLVCELAQEMAADLPNDPELTVGLRKLLEAKDCFVRAKLHEFDFVRAKLHEFDA